MIGAEAIGEPESRTGRIAVERSQSHANETRAWFPFGIWIINNRCISVTSHYHHAGWLYTPSDIAYIPERIYNSFLLHRHIHWQRIHLIHHPNQLGKRLCLSIREPLIRTCPLGLGRLMRCGCITERLDLLDVQWL